MHGVVRLDRNAPLDPPPPQTEVVVEEEEEEEEEEEGPKDNEDYIFDFLIGGGY